MVKGICNARYGHAQASYCNPIGNAGSTQMDPCARLAFDYFERIGFRTSANCAINSRIAFCKPPRGSGFENPPATYCYKPCQPTNGSLIFLSKRDLKCGTCEEFVNLLTTIYHECIHAKECSGDEKLAYCNEFRFVDKVLRWFPPGGPCEGQAEFLDIINEEALGSRQECRYRSGNDYPWPTDRPSASATE